RPEHESSTEPILPRDVGRVVLGPRVVAHDASKLVATTFALGIVAKERCPGRAARWSVLFAELVDREPAILGCPSPELPERLPPRPRALRRLAHPAKIARPSLELRAR